MSFAKKTINSLDLSKSEELSYQLSEVDYHVKSAHEALQEFLNHLNRISYHSKLAKAASEGSNE